MTRRLIGQIHLWIGVALCVPLVLLGLTGSVLVFEDALRAAFAPAPQAAAGAPKPVAEIVAAATAAAPPGFVPSSYAAPPEPGQFATVRLAPPGRQPGAEAVRVDVDPVSLATVANPPNDLLRQVFLLHANLLMSGRDGRRIIGWFGVAMLAMGVSGLVNWWPRRRAWRAAFTVSRQARGFRLLRELHGMAGIWGLLVFLTVSFGGVCLAFPETVRGLVDPLLPARDLRAASAAVKVAPVKGAERIGIAEAIALAQAQIADARPVFVFLPTRPDQPYRVALRRAGAERRETPVMVFIDPWTRRTAEILDPREFSTGETLLAMQHAMHAGQGLGPVWKALVFLSGLLPTLFATTGIMMWLKRRRSPAAADEIPIIDQAYTARRAGE